MVVMIFKWSIECSWYGGNGSRSNNGCDGKLELEISSKNVSNSKEDPLHSTVQYKSLLHKKKKEAGLVLLIFV